MRGEGSWGALAGGLAVLAVAGAVAAVLVMSGGEDDPSKVETVGSELSRGTTPVVITIGSTAPATTTTVAATSTTFPVVPTFAPDTEPETLPTPPPPPPARLEVAASTLDLGRDRSEGAVTIGNSGGQQLDWATSSDNGLVTATPGGSLAPAATTDVAISVNRAGLIEGEYAATVSVLGAGRAVPITVRWWVERSPVVHVAVEPAGLADGATCPPDDKDLTAVVRAAVIDESSVSSAVMTWTGPATTGSTELTMAEPGTWEGPLGPLNGAGTWTVTVTATDGRGNTGDGSTTLIVTACP